MRYKTPPKDKPTSDAVFWKDVDEGWIRYDQISGSTQLLTPLSRFVIDYIDKSLLPLSSSEIINAVLQVEPEADPDDCHVEVEATLRILSDAQLIISVQP